MSNHGWFIVGVIAYADIVLIALALCKAADRGDRAMGLKD